MHLPLSSPACACDNGSLSVVPSLPIKLPSSSLSHHHSHTFFTLSTLSFCRFSSCPSLTFPPSCSHGIISRYLSLLFDTLFPPQVHSHLLNLRPQSWLPLQLRCDAATALLGPHPDTHILIQTLTRAVRIPARDLSHTTTMPTPTCRPSPLTPSSITCSSLNVPSPP